MESYLHDRIKDTNAPAGWEEVEKWMHGRFGKDADLKSVLFVIGLREMGQRKTKITKEEKQDLMNLAFCTVMSLDGFFEVAHLDGEGWPVWRQKKALPPMTPVQQEEFIKNYVVRYFRMEKLIN